MPASMGIAFFTQVVHLGCEAKKFKLWIYVQLHNNTKHTDDAGYVNLSDRQAVDAKKHARCFIYEKTPATAVSNPVVTRIRTASTEEARVYEKTQTAKRGIYIAPGPDVYSLKKSMDWCRGAIHIT